MPLRFQFAHGLEPDEARRRLVHEADQQGIEVRFDPADPMAGEVAAKTPLGAAAARFRILPDVIEVEVTKKPAFVSASVLQSNLERGFTKLFG